MERNQAKKSTLSGENRMGKSPTPRQKSTKGMDVDLTNQRALTKKTSGNIDISHTGRQDSMGSAKSNQRRMGNLGGLGSEKGEDGKLSDIDLTGAIDTGHLRAAVVANPMVIRTKSPIDSEGAANQFGDGILAISNNMCDNSDQNSPKLPLGSHNGQFGIQYPVKPPQIQNFASSDGMNNFSQTLYNQHNSLQNSNQQLVHHHQKSLSTQHTQNTLNYFSNMLGNQQVGQHNNLAAQLGMQIPNGTDLNADLQNQLINNIDPQLYLAQQTSNGGEKVIKASKTVGNALSQNNIVSIESQNPLFTSSHKQNSKKVKKVPSKTKLPTEKGSGGTIHRKLGSKSNHGTDQTETSDQMRSHGSKSQGKSNPRATSQNNRISQQMIDGQPMIMPANLHMQMMHNNGNADQQNNQQQNFSFITQGGTPFQFAALSQTQQQQLLQQAGIQNFHMHPQPQVHFIAKQQKFYGISPDRAPIIFNNSNNEKRPYTSSGGQVLNKRTNESKKTQQSHAIAALYLGGKSTHSSQPGQNGGAQTRNMSQPNYPENPSSIHSMQTTANSMNYFPQKTGLVTSQGNSGLGHPKRTAVVSKASNSATISRKQQALQSHQLGALGNPANKEIETLIDENVKMKQLANKHKDENVKLKTKIKILENEVVRKERMLEDVLQQSQYIQNHQKTATFSGNLAPIVQTAQKYQQETFLVMSLKKQVKELKQELAKKDETLLNMRKNLKHTRTYELEQEIRVYKDELIRMRFLCEQSLTPPFGNQSTEMRSRQNSLSHLTGHQLSLSHQYQHTGQNMSQPTFNQTDISNKQEQKQTGSSKLTSSQKNFHKQDGQKAPIQSAWVTTGQNFYTPGGQQNVLNQTQSYQIAQTISNDDTSSQDNSQLMSNNGQAPQLPPLSKNTALNKQLQNGVNYQGILSALDTPQMGVTSSKGFDETPNQSSVQALTAMGHAATNSNIEEAQFQQIVMQLHERDQQIQTLIIQLNEMQNQKLLQSPVNVKTQPSVDREKEDNQKKEASLNEKKELTRLRKLLKDKDKEMSKLKTENTLLGGLKTQEEEAEKKLKALNAQINSQKKAATELEGNLKKKEEIIQKLNQDLNKVNETQKKAIDHQKKTSEENSKKLEAKLTELQKTVEQISKERDQYKHEVNQRSTKSSSQIEESEPQKPLMKDESPLKVESGPPGKTEDKQATDEELLSLLGEKEEGELCLVATVVGCREFKDRIEFALFLKNFVKKEQSKETETSKEKEKQKKKEENQTDYKLVLSGKLMGFISKASMDKLALSLPKYDLITPQLAVLIMKELKGMLCYKDLLDVLTEKENDTCLPFDALRDLCIRFQTPLSDEQCAFVTASYFTEIDQGVIFINFKEFLYELRDNTAGKYDLEMLRFKHGLSISESIGSDDSKDSAELKKAMRAASLSEAMQRSGGKAGKLARDRKKSVDEEYMLDMAEAIFVKLAELMIEKGRSVRGVFTKYSTPEMFSERTVIELLSPMAFLEGTKEAGLRELQDFEMACVMKVLAKPELDNSIVLNELVVIMENFGVADQMDEDEVDDYIPDTETEASVMADKTEPEEKVQDKAEKEVKNAEKVDDKAKDEKEKDEKKKSKKRVHNLANISPKGIKILRKLARFLLKQFLHPREFFGKSIIKEHIKTKKREFHIDVLKIKDFYLKVKIANIRKRLVEDESLNNELCLDKKTHKHLFNVKLLVKALEEIAEEEQVKLIKEEQEEAKANAEKKQSKLTNSSDPDTPRSDDGKKDTSFSDKKDCLQKQKEKDSKDKEKEQDCKEKEKEKEGRYGVGNDLMRFTSRMGGPAGASESASSRSPMLKGGFQHLNTIEEERYETHTSNYVDGDSQREDSKILNSSKMKSSHQNLEVESEKDLLKNADVLCGSLGKESNLSQHLPNVDNQSDLMISGRHLEGKLDHMLATDKVVSKSMIESSLENISQDTVKLEQSAKLQKFRNNTRHSATEILKESREKEESINEEYEEIEDLVEADGAGISAVKTDMKQATIPQDEIADEVSAEP